MEQGNWVRNIALPSDWFGNCFDLIFSLTICRWQWSCKSGRTVVLFQISCKNVQRTIYRLRSSQVGQVICATLSGHTLHAMRGTLRSRLRVSTVHATLFYLCKRKQKTGTFEHCHMLGIFEVLPRLWCVFRCVWNKVWKYMCNHKMQMRFARLVQAQNANEVYRICATAKCKWGLQDSCDTKCRWGLLLRSTLLTSVPFSELPGRRAYYVCVCVV